MKRPAAACTEPSLPAATVAALLPEASPAAKPDWYDAADDKAQLAVYLVTAAKLVNEEDLQSSPPLHEPARLSKQEFHKVVIDSLAKPVACCWTHTSVSWKVRLVRGTTTLACGSTSKSTPSTLSKLLCASAMALLPTGAQATQSSTQL